MKHSWIIAICCVIFILGVSSSQSVSLRFPTNFTIGCGTASYQIEGAWNVSDKGVSTWDHFTHNRPQSIVDRSNGDIACNSYYEYLEDVQWLVDLGVDFYRFSLSWSRILPNGFADRVSEAGIQYYKNLTGALLANNITPIVTIYHWDHPQILEDLGGWTNEMMAEWFADYARVVFEELGPLVKTFITINEPKILCEHGYNSTMKAPGKILGNMGHYLCVHNTLKAHARAYHIYDEEFRSTQKGEIGLVAPCRGWIPGENVTDASIEQSFLFDCGWIMHPIYIGDYPEIMKTRIANISALEGYPFSRLPEFSEEWIQYIRGTSDFFGLNHYTSGMPIFDPDEELGIYTRDSGIIGTVDQSWAIASSRWLYVVPAGLGNLLRYIRDCYNNPPLYMFENGYSDTGELEDHNRISYYYGYVSEMLKAVNEDGCNVQKYTIWSLMDNFEWEDGDRFGIISVDFEGLNRTRTAKLSASWWQEVLRTRILQNVPRNNSSRYLL